MFQIAHTIVLVIAYDAYTIFLIIPYDTVRPDDNVLYKNIAFEGFLRETENRIFPNRTDTMWSYGRLGCEINFKL